MDLEPYKTFWSSLFKPPTCRRLGAQPSLRWPCRRLLLSSTSWEKAELSTVPFGGGGARFGQTLPEQTSTGQGPREESRGLSPAGAALEQRGPCSPAASFKAPRRGIPDPLRAGSGCSSGAQRPHPHRPGVGG